MKFNRDVHAIFSGLMSIDYELYQISKNEKHADNYFQVADNKIIMALLDVFRPNSLPSEFIGKEQNLTDSISFYEQKILLNKGVEKKAYQEKLFVANQNMDDFLDELEVAYSNYYSEQYKALEISIADIQKELDASTLFVEYSISDTTLFIHAIAQDNHEIVKMQMSKEDLSAFNEMRTFLQDPLLVQNTKKTKFIEKSYLSPKI